MLPTLQLQRLQRSSKENKVELFLRRNVLISQKEHNNSNNKKAAKCLKKIAACKWNERS